MIACARIGAPNSVVFGGFSAVALASDFAGPLLKAEQNPIDGQLYVAGFQVWGTRSPGIRVLARGDSCNTGLDSGPGSKVYNPVRVEEEL